MADILYILTLVFMLHFVSAEYCNKYGWISSQYCVYGCCTDYGHSGYEKCCSSYNYDHGIAVGPIVGIVVGCVILIVIVISIIVCCVCCMRNSRRTQGQTITTGASGPYIMNQMTYGVQAGQTPYGQQPYPAQPPLHTEHMAPGTTLVNSQAMQGPPSYEKCANNTNNL
ncbi:cysteine and tyrosine-rich protein 1-like [Mya arenaria]|uniref:cysteine and tyrosine-rich protein 1-like n=1 Tax=Mya arenaria TaxID=6604 RepID=UPI0022E8F105|nr:cysteine and tyrosine-rich protein 1-like [Mya arenaria]